MDSFEIFSNLFLQSLVEIIEQQTDLSTFTGSVDWTNSENLLQSYSYTDLLLVQQIMQQINVTNQNSERVNWKEEGF